MSRSRAASLRLPDASASRMPAPDLGAWVTGGLAALGALLAVVASATTLGPAGWAVGLGCGVVLTTLVVRGLAHAGRATLGPADEVTFGRGLLACAVAGLTVESVAGRPVVPALVALTVPALVLDAVDGRLARRTGTVTTFGGRFDGEVDAFLILVLSVALGPSVGWWVLGAGLARYAFAVGGLAAPWLRAPLEFRYWRKVVTATVGIVLTVAVADVLPHPVALGAVLGAMALLGESFGRDVWWLWLHRPPHEPVEPRVARHGSRPRRALPAGAANGLALALVWFALLAPARPEQLTPRAVLRIPLEAVLIGTLGLALPARRGRAVALTVGTVLGVVAVLRALDLGAFVVLGRPFDLVTDAGLTSGGVSFVHDSLGAPAAVASVLLAVLVVGGFVVGLPWAVAHLSGVVARHRLAGARVVSALAVGWAVCALMGVSVATGEPVAAFDTASFVTGKVHAARIAYRDRDRFERAIADDRFAAPASGDLAALRGKDVVIVVVESYGRVALEGPGAATTRTLLDAGAARLRARGLASTSGWLTSPTFGGSSWLAHSTLQSGLTVGDQGRYDRLLRSRRTTLTSAFSRAGWRTVAVLPSTRGHWPEGRAFYRFDEVYGRSDLGYAGPSFGFSAMPDQFTLAALDRLELARPHRTPLMAEVELTSSHGPWAPLPRTVPSADLGDGAVFRGIRADAVTPARLWSDRAAVPAAYRTSIEYSLTTVLSFVEKHADDDLVVVILGDHQPSTIVSGFGGNRDVPVTVVARDPAVLARVSGWRWQEGLRPDDHAPVWPMAAFRDRFLTAYSSPEASRTTPGPP